MMIEKVKDFEWIEGTDDDFQIEGASKNASEGPCGRKRMRNLEVFRSTGITSFDCEQLTWQKDSLL